jgi:hypothetical protein
MGEEVEAPKQKEPITFRVSYPGIRWPGPNEKYSTFFLTQFPWLASEDPNTFLFEFDVLCRSYDYSSDAQKLKLFPTTLKEATLHWFMGLGGNSIKTWDEMRQKFLKKY